MWRTHPSATIQDPNSGRASAAPTCIVWSPPACSAGAGEILASNLGDGTTAQVGTCTPNGAPCAVPTHVLYSAQRPGWVLSAAILLKQAS